MYVQSVGNWREHPFPRLSRGAARPATLAQCTRIELTADRAHRLRSAAREHGVTAAALVQTAWLILLDALTGDGRLDQAMPIRAVARMVARQELPTDTVARLEFGEIDSRVYLDLASARPRPPLGNRFTLELSLTPGIVLRLRHLDGSVERGAAEQLADCLQRVLEAIMAGPDQPICRVEVLGDEDRRRIRGRWSDPPGTLTVVELFEDQVDRVPDRPALRCAGRTLSYAELERRANRMANALLAQQPDPAAPVVLGLPLTPELVTGLLAALKAGLTCVITAGPARPADTSGHGYPDTRPPSPDRPARVAVSTSQDEASVTLHHGALLNGCLEAAADAPTDLVTTDLITTVLLPLITGATLVVPEHPSPS